MMAAVQVYNNPQITFKSEIFIVNAVIAWTYLLQAYYRDKNIEYRYVRKKGKKRVFDKTKHGATKYWDLETCINSTKCPLKPGAINNLKYLIGIRHEIEHQMTLRIDNTLSSRFQACALNFDAAITALFGENHSLAKELAFALQFSGIGKEQKDILEEFEQLPTNIQSFNATFETGLTDDQFNDPAFAYRVFFVEKSVNHKGQADQVVEFVKAGSEEAQEVNRVLIKSDKQQKVGAKEIVTLVHRAGFANFSLRDHTDLWKTLDAQDETKGYGEKIHQWWWYKDRWLKVVLQHCRANPEKYK